jgi:transcriptional regulator with XRE-family HTH domain
MPQIPSILSAVDFTAPRPDWTSALARYTRQRREELGLSLERAAELAGMQMSEWDALESGGWMPASDNLPLIRAIAGTLEVSWMDYSVLALMADCQQHRPEESAGEA